MVCISNAGYRARIIGLKENGEIIEVQTEISSKYQLDSYEQLNGAVKICAGEVFTAGLMPDGTLRVVCGGDYEEAILDAPDEVEFIDLPALDNTKDVLDINSTGDVLIVLKKDGTVLTGGVEYLD